MELLDIVDENNNPTGQVAERKEAHKKCLWHRHVSAWIMNEKGQILMQKRSAQKHKNPNKWSKTGGHVDAGETVEHAIAREVKEEVGIEIKKENLKFLTVMFQKSEKKYINFWFTCDEFKGEPKNCEQDKCEKIGWYDIEKLPENIAQKENKIINDYKNNKTLLLDEYGWSDI